ncbi:hypothetical protein PMAYCL1PPCAC_03001 [Pristionchus mayeri]|uniref:Uncharacterized protein n=1 Tax=Pristionchus mayeri TaxID=1317129 RepID=A0AAN4Z2S0_9BILA|nr:hypothetical protein PMAYCL1PPCAC_03001 [Pristionchus mayeri]
MNPFSCSSLFSFRMDSSSSVDLLQSITPLEIPRPKCHGMQFVPTRGRYGFYRTIRAEGSKYGVSIKGMGPRRPVLSKDLFTRPAVIEEEERGDQSQGSTESINHNSSSSSASSQISSDRSSPIEIEPDYPLDDIEEPPSRPAHPTTTTVTTNQRPILSTKF